MNTLLDQTANQELARQYRANRQEKSIRARLIREEDPTESPAPRRKSFKRALKPKIAFGMAIVTLTNCLTPGGNSAPRITLSISTSIWERLASMRSEASLRTLLTWLLVVVSVHHPSGAIAFSKSKSVVKSARYL